LAQFFKKFVARRAGDGHAFSHKRRMQQPVAPRQVDQITAGLIKCPF
jgi:hypothetical protein